MRILLDARPLQGPTGRRGVGAYVRRLAGGMLEADDTVSLVLLVDSRRDPPHDPPQGDGVGGRVTICDAAHPPGPDVLWSRWAGPSWCRAAAAELLHATFLAPPRPATGVPLVATVHDLIPLDHPGAFDGRVRWIFRRSLAHAAAADRIAAVSHATAKRFVARFPEAEGRVEVVPPPVDVAVLAAAVPRPPAGVTGRYLLHLGGLDPLKGVEELLLPALARLRGEWGLLSLVVTGESTGPRARATQRAAEAAGLGGRIVFTGHLDESARASCIAAAEGVVVASRDEGFGLPVAEGLASGVPVAVGPSEAAREAANGGAVLAEGGTPEALAEAIDRALSSGGRHGPAAEARRRAATSYAPEAVGAKMVELYRAALEAVHARAR